jgi:anaerobic nitric oxide reductase flavorubredoxin
MTKEIIKNISWIGVNNPESRDFHGINTPRGGSYNSYLIEDESPTIIDGVNKPFFKEYLKSLKETIKPEKVKFIVLNHIEPDHTGALVELLKECKNATILCSEKCKEFLEAMFDITHNIRVVNDNEEISLGKYTLRFLIQPMIHWPETMMTYLIDEKILFSGDLFGTEISHEKLFADEMKEFKELTRDYYAIVFRPQAYAVNKAIERIKDLKLNYIFSTHGPVYRKNLDKIINYYSELSNNAEEDKVLIIYFSVWHSTQKMANQIAKGVISEGKKVVMYDLADCNFVRLQAEALTSKAIALGSLTILGGYHPLFETLFSFLKLNRQKKKFALFGSYGWVDSSIPQMENRLLKDGNEVLFKEAFRFGKMNKKDLNLLTEIGRELSRL